MSHVHNFDQILVNQKEWQKKGSVSPQRRISFDGLLRVLCGETELFQTKLLSYTERSVIPRIRFLIFDILENTTIDPFAGSTPLIDNGKGNVMTMLRHGRYASRKSDTTVKGAGGYKKWAALKTRFMNNRSRVLEEIFSRFKKQIQAEELDAQVLDSLSAVYCYVFDATNPRSWYLNRPVCYRQLTLLFLAAFFDEKTVVDCSGWVKTGEFPINISANPDDSLAKYFGSGIFSLKKENIQEKIIPSIKIKEDNTEHVFRFHIESDSPPLGQLLSYDINHQLFLICGAGDSSTSGSGKTTSLRDLYYRYEHTSPIFVPLCKVYRSSLSGTYLGKTCQSRLLTWLVSQNHDFSSVHEMRKRLILLDGLDEIRVANPRNPIEVQDFCSDLLMLLENPNLIVIVSSKLEPEKLATWDLGLNEISSTWDGCRRGFIQPMSDKQKQPYLKDLKGGDELENVLTSPFLLTLYKDVATFLSATPSTQKSSKLLSRWLSKTKLRSEVHNAEDLIYRYLVVQLCRWFDSGEADDVQNEIDTFFLMFALPRIAFQEIINEIYDRSYVPTVAPLSTALADQLLDLCFQAFVRALCHYPCYQNSNGLQVLGSRENLLNSTTFSRGRATSVLYKDLNIHSLTQEYHFVNHALREHLALLHVANLFFSSFYNALKADSGLIPFYICPLYYFPRTSLKKIIHLVDELFGKDGHTESILLADPPKKQTDDAFSRYLLSSIATELCDSDELQEKAGKGAVAIAKGKWRAACTEAYQMLHDTSPEIAEVYQMDHVIHLCGQAQEYRQCGCIDKSIKKAREAINFRNNRPGLKNSDGHHYLAKAYLEEITYILNQDRDVACLFDVPENEVCFSHKVKDELEHLVNTIGVWQSTSDVFGRLLPQNTDIAQPLFLVLEKAFLRYEEYREKDLFHDPTVKFLLTASYVAKAHSVFAAFHEGASGAALNMLACFLENNQEELENHQELPFFQKNKHLHLPLDPDHLSYPNNHLNAFLVYLRIYNIARGKQPYSAKKLSHSLLSRRVRLGEEGRPVSVAEFESFASSEEKSLPFTEKELKFLDEATGRACTGQGMGYKIPRIRFLNDLLQHSQKLTKTIGFHYDVKVLSVEARRLFFAEWCLCNCEGKLNANPAKSVDLYATMLAAEYNPEYNLLHGNSISAWISGICSFYEKELLTDYWLNKEIQNRPSFQMTDQVSLRDQLKTKHHLKYTTGTRMQNSYLSECLMRLLRLETIFPSLRNFTRDNRWTKITDKLEYIIN